MPNSHITKKMINEESVSYKNLVKLLKSALEIDTQEIRWQHEQFIYDTFLKSHSFQKGS